MRRLILLRHSTAQRAEPGRSDQERALTPQGEADAATIGNYLANHSFRPDHVVVSPSTRTRETWQQIVAALGAAPNAIFDERIYNATAQALFDVVAETPDTAGAVLLLGHNPGLHELAMLLVATGDIDTRERLRENFPTSGLAIIDFALDSWSKLHSRSARLERFVGPKIIAIATN